MWSDDERPEHPIEASLQLLGRFLIDPADLLATLAPDGWEHSPLMRIFHPTPERLRIEHERMRRDLGMPSGKDDPDHGEAADDPPASPEPDRPIEPEREVVELLGCALWDVFAAPRRPRTRPVPIRARRFEPTASRPSGRGGWTGSASGSSAYTTRRSATRATSPSLTPWPPTTTSSRASRAVGHATPRESPSAPAARAERGCATGRPPSPPPPSATHRTR